MQVTRYSGLVANQSTQTMIGRVELHLDENNSIAHHQPYAFDLGLWIKYNVQHHDAQRAEFHPASGIYSSRERL